MMPAVRGGGRGFPRLQSTFPPGYFHKKIEEKRIESKEIPSCLIPRLLVLFTRQLEILEIALNCYSCRKPQFCSDSVWYQKKFFPLFVSRVFSQIWKGRILASSQQILIGYSLCSAKTTSGKVCYTVEPCGGVLTNNRKVFPLVLFLVVDFSYNCCPYHSKISYSASRIILVLIIAYSVRTSTDRIKSKTRPHFSVHRCVLRP